MALWRRKPFLYEIGKRRSELLPGKVTRVRIRNTLVVLASMVIVLWAVRYSQVRAQRKQALVEILVLQESVRAFRWDQGRCPHDMEELLWPPAGGDPYYRRELKDPWDKPYRMICPGRMLEDAADVASSGPDGEFYTADDVKPH